MISFNLKNRDCLSKNEVYKYISTKQELDVDELRSIEEHMINCDLCSDAIDGYICLKEHDPLNYEMVLGGDYSTNEEFLLKESPSIEHDQSRGKVFHMPFKPETSIMDEAEQMTFRTKDKKQTKSVAYYLSRIAAIGLIFILTTGVYYFLDTNKNRNLLSLYGDGSEYGTTLRGENTINSSLDEAFSAFSQEDFQKSAKYFHKTLDQNGEENISIAFYLGMSYMNLKNWNSAKEYLSKTAYGNNEFSLDALYYLSKIHLVEGDKTKAKKLLIEIKNSDRKDLKEKATTILDQW